MGGRYFTYKVTAKKKGNRLKPLYCFEIIFNNFSVDNERFAKSNFL